ncbi:MAG TPA: DUF5993 family protein [Hyphomicrobium sp.]|jgi:hypothetical protein
MDILVVFLALTASLWVAWRGPRRGALLLFAGAMMLTVALYLHHATETLPLSL